MNTGILEEALNEVMTCNGSGSILENRNCHESLGAKLVLRCNNSRYTSDTSFCSAHKYETRMSYEINAISTLGMKAFGKGEIQH